MQNAVKPTILAVLAIFLYSRVVSGAIFFYINERFTTLTLVAAVGLVLVAGSYFVLATRRDTAQNNAQPVDRRPITWAGYLLLALPFILGWLVPPAPLGASALANRQLDIGGSSLGSLSASGDARLATMANDGQRNVLDWVRAMQQQPDLTQFAGEEVDVVGFVYRDERFGEDQFLVARYVLSCCVADAAPIGLVVSWPDAPDLAVDQWVEVKGAIAVQTFNGAESAVVIAQTITAADRPQQPYLYP